MTVATAACTACKPCRVMLLTTQQFMKLGGEKWERGFLVRVGLKASTLHHELLGKAPKKQRSNVRGAHRNQVGLYPCGILEQAYRQVLAEQAAKASPPDSE